MALNTIQINFTNDLHVPNSIPGPADSAGASFGAQRASAVLTQDACHQMGVADCHLLPREGLSTLPGGKPLLHWVISELRLVS